MKQILKKASILITIFLLIVVAMSFAQRPNPNADRKLIGAKIKMDKYGRSPVAIWLATDRKIPVASFFEEYRKSFSLSRDNNLIRFKAVSDKLGQTHYRFKQSYKGVEIEGVQFMLHEKGGGVSYANGRLIHDVDLDVTPALSEEQALKGALSYINAEAYMWENESQETFLKKIEQDENATFYPKGELRLSSGKREMIRENLRLVYRFDIYAEKPLGRYYVYVDANTGEVINSIDRIHISDVAGTGLTLYNGSQNITIDSFVGGYRLREVGRGGGVQTWDMQHGTDYGAAVDFVDNNTDFTDPNAQAGVSAHWATEHTYDYYLNEHGRNSFDNAGATLYSYVHYSSNYNNAFWNGMFMTYGDGDGITFTPLVSIDVVAHELTHGVTQYSADLIYSYESGALNESFSDIFGTAVEFYIEGPAGDWICGEDITPSGAGIRSLENPNVHGDPDTYLGDYWYTGSGDNGGVHTNSGVQNFWFYLLSVGGSGTNDNGDPYSVTGIGLDAAAQIAYRNLTVYLVPSSQYYDARDGAINAAIDLFGDGSAQHQAVMDAWDAVGVYELPPPEGILVWEGILGGQDYSGAYINNHLINAGYTNITYTNIFPPSLIGYDAVFLSFGNYGNNYTPFNDGMASAVQQYLQAGGKVYLEGGDALGFNQSGNTVLHGLFGLSGATDGSTNIIDGLQGQPGAITEGMLFTSSTQVGNSWIDTYTPSTGTLAFVESGYGNVGVQYKAIGVQTTFCFSYALAELVDSALPSTKANLMAKIVDFFEFGASPVIVVVPPSFDVTLPEGGTTTQTMTISNTGEGALNFNISIQNASANVSVSASSSGVTSIRTNLSPDETASNNSYNYVNQSIVAVPFYDGFESGNFNAWINDAGSGTKEVTNATAAEGTYSFHYANISGDYHFHGIHQEFSAGSQPDYVSFYIRSGSTTSHDAYVVITANGNNTEVIWFYAKGTGCFYVNADVGGDEAFPYNALQWYHIEFKDINWSTKNFDYYVDGSLIKADIPFRNAAIVNDIDRLYLYNFSPNAQAWWDGIAVGSQLGWLSVVGPTSGTVPPGGSIVKEFLFDATELLPGDYYANIRIMNNDPLHNPVIVPAHLEVFPGITPPDIAVSPPSFTFNVLVDGSDSDEMTISNTAAPGAQNLIWYITEQEPTPLGQLSNDGIAVAKTSWRRTMVQADRLPIAESLTASSARSSFNDDKLQKANNSSNDNGGCDNGSELDQPQPATLTPLFIASINGGYEAKGVGMRGVGSGNIILSEIPGGATIEAAFLYWDYVANDPPEPGTNQGVFNGTPITGTLTGSGPSPCWPQTSNFSYRADVTGLVTGNGTYSLTGFIDSGDFSISPSIEGAGLIVIYSKPGLPLSTIVLIDGNTTLIGDYVTETISGFTASDPVLDASIAFLVADGQPYTEEIFFNGLSIAVDDLEGSDGEMWDTDRYNVTSLVPPGATSVTASIRSIGDCLVWIASIFSVSGSCTDCPWLSEVPPNGMVAPGSSENVNILVDATGLAPGTYACNMMINSNDPDENPVTVPVTLNVGEPANALIWISDDVLNPDLVSKAQQRGMTLDQVQIIAHKVTSHLELQAALEANGKAVEITNDLTMKTLSDYDYVFVVLGIFPNNHVISAGDPEATQLANYLAGGGKLYIEGGDVWYFDPTMLGGYNFGPSFSIAATHDGADDLKMILGSAFALGMDFIYKGHNSFIDHISPAGSTAGSDATIHFNHTPSYGCGVAFDKTTATGYRTIGNSFEFGGLQDNSIPGSTTKIELMAKYLAFFDTGLPTAVGQVAAEVAGLANLVTGCPVTFSVTVDLTETEPAELLGAYTAKLYWDPAIITYESYVGGTPPFNNPIVNEANTAAGELTFTQFAPLGAGGEVNVIKAKFTVVGDPGLSGLVDVNFSDLLAAITFHNLLPIAVIEDATFVTEQGCLLGDVTNDGDATIFDALIIATYDVGLEIPPEYLDRINQGCGDVTVDSETTIFDALVIATADVGIPVPYPVGNPHCPEE